MKDLAPEIYRQRLIIEGTHKGELTPHFIEKFLHDLSKELKMTIVFGPKVMNLAGNINPKHGGIEGVLVWAESGAQFYSWDIQKFFTLDIYSCKRFDVDTVIEFVTAYISVQSIVHKEI